ncbi:MAG: FAD-dependent oxidoreductase [Clostridia bacterium]|nr:FAD-dependent oxidoreductase [Clostridia bacterium]
MKRTTILSVLLCLSLLVSMFTVPAMADSFSATEEGFGGDVKVTLTVEEGKVTEVTIEGAGETEALGGAAMPVIAEEILTAQSPYVDAVTGATVTSTAALAAAEKAFASAGLNVEKPEEIKGEDEEVEADVVVIGMGASGTFAAVSAAENGAKVIGIEMTSGLGGMGNAAQGMFAIDSVLQHERYGDDLGTDEQYWFEHIFDRTQYLGNGKLIRTLVAESAETVQYVLDHDIAMYLSAMPQQIAHFDETVVYHRWNNTQPFVHMAEYIEKNNVDVRFGTHADALTKAEDGSWVVTCTKADNGTLTVHAKAVIMATGSFAGNEAMMREALGDDVYEAAFVIGGCDGTGLQMLYDNGAAKGELLTMNHGVGPRAASTPDGGAIKVATQLTMNTPILWVNRQGERFMNEDLLKDTVEFSSAVLAQGGYAYTIVDEATVNRWADDSYENTGSWIHYWDQNGMLDENGEHTIYHAPISKEDFVSDFAVLTESGDGIVANTLEEAAAFIGCDSEVLKTTVENYNSYVKSGKDDEFFKSAESLLWTVEEGPFYVTKGYNAVLGALGGVNANEKLEVLTKEDHVIPGLYATGNNLSGISVAAYGNVEGVGLSTALTTGRLAGVYAAEYAQK